jgi:Conjugative transposon protein TcpC
MALASPSQRAVLSAPPQQTGAGAGEVAAVGEWAQSFVIAWLSTPAGGEQALRYYIDDTSALTLPQTPRVATGAAVADMQLAPAVTASSSPPSASSTATTAPSGAPRATRTPTTSPSTSSATAAAARGQVWMVTVGVDVEEPQAEGPRLVRRYFAVPVAYTAGSEQQPTTLRALTLPGPVSAPTPGTGPQLAYTDALDPAGSIGSSVSAFLSAYLTGQGDVTRLLSPQAPTIEPVQPVAYTAVQLRKLATADRAVDASAPDDDAQVQVLATVLLTGLDQQSASAQYALTLTARDGRWEISAVQTAPQQTVPAPQGDAARTAGAASPTQTSGATSAG